MNTLPQLSHPFSLRTPCRSLFSEKLAKIIKACENSQKLTILIYLIEEQIFLYGNDAFKKMTGGEYPRLFKEGWGHWWGAIVPEEALLIKNSMANFLDPPYYQDRIRLKYHREGHAGQKMCLAHEIVLKNLENHTLAINYFFDNSEKERIEKCLNGKGGHSSTNGSFKTFMSISPREREVLHLVANGLSSKQIAEKLFISNHTAISHRKHLIEKFQVKNTAQLIKKASKIMEL